MPAEFHSEALSPDAGNAGKMPPEKMSPRARYEHDLKRSGFVRDSAQENAVNQLQALFERLSTRHCAPQQGFVVRLVRRVILFVSGSFSGSAIPPERGLYLWGGVGRGKTYLMDIFYDALPFQKKMRTHFHRFMRRVHNELTKLRGAQDPLNIVADTIASETQVICFDEFFVVDITDAMMLANLLEALFERGVTLVATSNIAPDGLYKDGLQRVRFLPAIQMLKVHTDVVRVDGGVDYRLRALEQADLYYAPLTEASAQAMAACFERLAPDLLNIEEWPSLDVGGRPIQARRVSDDVAWFDFKAVCDGPRSQHDYIDLAKEYHAVLVSDVPVFGAENDDQARRFMYLVDEFYDRGVKLVVSAEKPIAELYGKGRLAFEFQRTVSRIQEMQSHDYLAKPHQS